MQDSIQVRRAGYLLALNRDGRLQVSCLAVSGPPRALLAIALTLPTFSGKRRRMQRQVATDAGNVKFNASVGYFEGTGTQSVDIDELSYTVLYQ